MFSNFRTKLAAALRTNAAKIEPVSMEFPYDSEAYEYRLDAFKLLQVSEVGKVDSILNQIFMLVMNGRDIKIVLPEDQNANTLQNKSNEARKMLWRLDTQYDTGTLMQKSGMDTIIFGSGLIERGIIELKDGYSFPKTDMGWNAPAWLQYIDAYSFSEQPSDTMNTQAFVPGRLLKGIAYDIAAKKTRYWQLKTEGRNPEEIPSSRIIQIRDSRSRYPDGKSYMAGIAPTVLQWEATRKAFMQNMNYKGVGRMLIKVNEARTEAGMLLPNPDGSTAKPRWYNAWKAAQQTVKNYGNNNVSLLWPEHEPIFPNLGNVGDICKPDEYLKQEILNHLIPRDFIEQNGQAISTTGAPLLELVMMVVHGWRQIISAPFEALYTEILEVNGYQDWAVEFTFADPNLENKVEKQKLALQAASLGLMPTGRLYEEMGWQPLSEDELAEMQEAKANNGGMM
jgi:hypothetical protein